LVCASMYMLGLRSADRQEIWARIKQINAK